MYPSGCPAQYEYMAKALRRCEGLSGSAAIIAEMSDGLANCFCGQPRLNPPLNPSGGQGLGEAACCANRSPPSNTTPMHTATLNVFTMVETPVLEHYLVFCCRAQLRVEVTGKVATPSIG